MNRKSEIYTRESYRRNSEIEKIQDSFSLKTDAFGIIKKYLKIILICLILFTIFLLIGSIPVLPIYFIIIILFISIIFFNSYKVTGKNNKITIMQDMQEIELDYSQIKNVYIARYVTRVFFRKIYSYSIVIIYETARGKVLDINLPTLFLNPSQIEKFLNNFTVKKTKKDYIQMANKSKMKRKLIRLLLFVLFLILLVVTYLVQK